MQTIRLGSRHRYLIFCDCESRRRWQRRVSCSWLKNGFSRRITNTSSTMSLSQSSREEAAIQGSLVAPRYSRIDDSIDAMREGRRRLQFRSKSGSKRGSRGVFGSTWNCGTRKINSTDVTSRTGMLALPARVSREIPSLASHASSAREAFPRYGQGYGSLTRILLSARHSFSPHI